MMANYSRSPYCQTDKHARRTKSADRSGSFPSRDKYPTSPQNLPSEKLHKKLAQVGLGSRREMEAMILDGKIEVNGKVATVGQRIGPQDRIYINRRPVKINFDRPLPQVLLYYKPEGEIVSRHDPGGRPNVFQALPPVKGGKWIAIGRLDFNTSGLMLFTTNGELANFMMHPSHEVEREYAVRLIGNLTPSLIEKLCHEVLLEDGPAHFDTVTDKGGLGTNHWYHVSLKEGRNREVRRIFEAVGLAVSRLIRIKFGPIALPSRLKRGQYLDLGESDIRDLLRWAGFAMPDYTPQRNGEGTRHTRR
ncbi:MAG: pseudouridine synthase [Pseudomonadota bacterium]|nr:pseudouridine synthase [Pseudomonadota bacterium]